MNPNPQTLIAYGIANGWIKKSVPNPVTPDLEQKRTIIRESMRRLRAKRYAQGLNAVGEKRVRRENRAVLCENLKREWDSEFKCTSTPATSGPSSISRADPFSSGDRARA